MKHIAILILVVILSLVSFNCCVAAEDASEQINLRKTDAERKAELDNALSGISYSVTDFDKIAFQDGLKRSKNNFTRLYRSQWKALGMNEKLERAIDVAFDENTKDLLWGTAGIQIASNKGDIISKIQEAVAFKFNEHFEDFLRDIEEKWSGTLQKDVSDFYRRTSVLLLASDNNPMTQAYIRSSSAAEDKGLDVMERIKLSMQKKYPDLKVSGSKLAGGFAAFILRQQINKMIGKQLMKTGLRKLAGSAIQQAAKMAVPVAGWALMAWSAWDVASIAWNAPDEVRNMLQERNKALYYNEIPEIYWDAMEPYVMDTFVFSYENLQKTKEEASVLASDPHVSELARGLNDEETMQFIERISALSRILGRSGYDDLLSDFGELIRDSSRRDFDTLAAMLQQGNKLQVKEWLRVAGAKYFDLYNSFSNDTWEIFPPNQESLDALTWIVKLPPKARNIAVKLSMSDIQWIMNELPERYISNLFSNSVTGGNDPDKIHSEIRRLSTLPEIETRRPWQSGLSYAWILYGFYFKIVIVLLLLFFAVRVVFSLKNRPKKSKEQAQPGASSVVNINIPSYMPTQIPTSTPDKKYKVKAKISAKLASELKTITWDISQQILPSNDDSDNRILSVELETLDEIAAWIAKNKNDIEVLQPEELKERLIKKESF
ncbi:MAG: WYL domain-containing protein [Synergistaceae bacterium]|nr:WYL domain-containing protein [Synergistaceae bacterium]